MAERTSEQWYKMLFDSCIYNKEIDTPENILNDVKSDTLDGYAVTVKRILNGEIESEKLSNEDRKKALEVFDEEEFRDYMGEQYKDIVLKGISKDAAVEFEQNINSSVAEQKKREQKEAAETMGVTHEAKQNNKKQNNKFKSHKPHDNRSVIDKTAEELEEEATRTADENERARLIKQAELNASNEKIDNSYDALVAEGILSEKDAGKARALDNLTTLSVESAKIHMSTADAANYLSYSQRSTMAGKKIAKKFDKLSQERAELGAEIEKMSKEFLEFMAMRAKANIDVYKKEVIKEDKERAKNNNEKIKEDKNIEKIESKSEDNPIKEAKKSSIGSKLVGAWGKIATGFASIGVISKIRDAIEAQKKKNATEKDQNKETIRSKFSDLFKKFKKSGVDPQYDYDDTGETYDHERIDREPIDLFGKAEQLETEQLETEQPETEQLETKQPETEQPEINEELDTSANTDEQSDTGYMTYDEDGNEIWVEASADEKTQDEPVKMPDIENRESTPGVSMLRKDEVNTDTNTVEKTEVKIDNTMTNDEIVNALQTDNKPDQNNQKSNDDIIEDLNAATKMAEAKIAETEAAQTKTTEAETTEAETTETCVKDGIKHEIQEGTPEDLMPNANTDIFVDTRKDDKIVASRGTKAHAPLTATEVLMAKNKYDEQKKTIDQTLKNADESMFEGLGE